MQSTNLQFENFAKWATWTSAVSSMNPSKQLRRIGAPVLLGKNGGVAAETLAWHIFDQVTKDCKRGLFSFEPPDIEVDDVFRELQEILKSHGLVVTRGDEVTLIRWGEQLYPMVLKSPYMLGGATFGRWAYWFAKSVLAKPEETLTQTDEAVAARLSVPRLTEWQRVNDAVVDGETEATVSFHPSLRQHLPVIRNDFRLNGFRFEQSERPNGEMQLKIHIRQPDPYSTKQ